MNKNTQKKEIRFGKLGCAFVALMVLLACFGCGGDKTVKPQYDENNNPVYIEAGKENNIYSSPDEYKGQFIDLTGQVFNKDTDEGVTYLQIYTDPEDYDGNTFIYCEDGTDLEEDDYVKVTGYVLGTVSFTNAMGGEVSAPAVMATKLEKSTYMDVERPAIKTMTYTDKVINQKGYQIEVTKVEFAEEETRIYVKAENKAKDDFSIYTYSVVAVQNGKQFENDSNYNYGDEYDLDSDLKPGVTSEGMLVMEAMEPADFTLIISGSSGDWNINLKDYKFELAVE